MSKYEDFVFIAPAKQKIVSTVGVVNHTVQSVYVHIVTISCTLSQKKS